MRTGDFIFSQEDLRTVHWEEDHILEIGLVMEDTYTTKRVYFSDQEKAEEKFKECRNTIENRTVEGARF